MKGSTELICPECSRQYTCPSRSGMGQGKPSRAQYPSGDTLDGCKLVESPGASPQSPGGTAAQRERVPTGAAASTLSQSRRQLPVGMEVLGRQTWFWQREVLGAWAGLMHLLCFFLLCKARRCPRVSARSPSSCGWPWVPAGSGDAGRQVAVVTPVVVSLPATPWRSPTTTSAPSTTGKAWGIGRGPLPQSSSVKDSPDLSCLDHAVLCWATG